MKYLYSTATQDVFTATFDGIAGMMIRDKLTGEILFHYEDLNCMGYSNIKEMLLANPDLFDLFLEQLRPGEGM